MTKVMLALMGAMVISAQGCNCWEDPCDPRGDRREGWRSWRHNDDHDDDDDDDDDDVCEVEPDGADAGRRRNRAGRRRSDGPGAAADAGDRRGSQGDAGVAGDVPCDDPTPAR